MKKYQLSKYIVWTITISLIATFFSLIYVFSISYAIGQQARFVKKTCADFTSYADAMAAYKDGDIRLDGNKDKIPCNELFKSDK